MKRYHIYYSSNGKVIHHIVHDEEERKELVYSLTHCSDPGIKFIGCIVTHLVYSLIFVDWMEVEWIILMIND